jgi:hypothetical protein
MSDRIGPRLFANICKNDAHYLTRRVRGSLPGVKGTHLPPNLHGRFEVDGHMFVVLASKGQGTGRKTAKHRIYYEAGNGTLIPTGRINQSAVCKGKGVRSETRWNEPSAPLDVRQLEGLRRRRSR